jgi:hypothetical protein
MSPFPPSPPIFAGQRPVRAPATAVREREAKEKGAGRGKPKQPAGLEMK